MGSESKRDLAAPHQKSTSLLGLVPALILIFLITAQKRGRQLTFKSQQGRCNTIRFSGAGLIYEYEKRRKGVACLGDWSRD